LARRGLRRRWEMGIEDSKLLWLGPGARSQGGGRSQTSEVGVGHQRRVGARPHGVSVRCGQVTVRVGVGLGAALERYVETDGAAAGPRNMRKGRKLICSNIIISRLENRASRSIRIPLFNTENGTATDLDGISAGYTPDTKEQALVPVRNTN